MADSFTPSLRARLQETGANTNTWGGLLNAAAIQILEDAIAGRVSVTVAGSDVVLSTNNGATDQARMAIIALVGSPGATRNITVPSVSKMYVIENLTGSDQVVRAGATPGVTVAAGTRRFLICDGTQVQSVSADSGGTVANSDALGGIAAALYKRLDLSQSFTTGWGVTTVALSDGATINTNCNLSNNFSVTLGGNRTLANPTNLRDGQPLTWVISQDGTGNRTLTLGSLFRVVGGGALSLSTGANAIDVIRGVYIASLNLILVEIDANFSTPVASSLTFDRNELNVNLWRRVGSPVSAVTVNITINPGVILSSHSVAEAALDLRGFANGSVINIINNGYIIGHGGRGSLGAAGAGNTTNGDGTIFGAEPAEAGGPAIFGAGAGITVNITNANGRIWGGGGGGGGGGFGISGGAAGAGGGGGGGAGWGKGAQPSRGSGLSVSVTSSRGADGVADLSGSNSGGAGGGAGSNGGAGGAGGDFGAGGTAGTTPGGAQVSAAAGGAAGLAVNVNSSTVVFVNGNSSPNVKGAVA